jgi:hypothetical protein
MTLSAFAADDATIGAPKTIAAAVPQETKELRMSLPQTAPSIGPLLAYREEERSAKRIRAFLTRRQPA